jgi:hypothetical protein
MKQMGNRLLLGLLTSSLTLAGAAGAAKPAGAGTPPAKTQPAAAAPKPAAAAPKPAAAAPKPEPAAPKKKLGPAPDKATNAKVNAYIDIINEQAEAFNTERRDWLGKIDRKQGPTCKENVSIPHPIGPDGGIFDAYRKRLKAKPALPPDAAAMNMVDAIEELRKIGKEDGPHTEYQGRSEPGSWCKKLKATFPRLLVTFDKFHEGEREVRAYVENFTDERDERSVQDTLKKYGNHYRHRFAVIALEGKRMIRSVGTELGKDAPDAEAIGQTFAAFFALADEAKATMDKEPRNQKTEPFPNPFQFFLIESVPKIKRASATLLETLAKKPDKKREEWLERDWHAVVAGYNDMVTYMNQVSFEKNQK